METQRLKLSLLTSSDFDEILEMYKEPEAFRFIHHLNNKSKEEYIAFLKLKLDQIKSNKGYYWTSRMLESKELVGAINLTPIPFTKDIQIGWQVREKFQKQGFAYEAAKKVMEFAFQETSLTQIYSVFEKDNIASEHIIKKLNFEYHSTKKEGDNELLVFMRNKAKSPLRV